MSELKQYLYKITPVRPEMVMEAPTDDEARIVSEHFQYLKKLTEEGVMILVGRTLNNDYSTFGIAVFVAESDEAAREILYNDPAVKNRVMRGEVFPYRIALMNADAVKLD
jgi:uncharacterized protein YciI